MVSAMAVEDVEEIEDGGVRLSPAEIVRLNSLALRVDHGPTAHLYAAPRVCQTNGFVFREPTLGHEIWYGDVERLFDLSDPAVSLVVRAMCLSLDVRELPAWDSQKTMLDAVRDFAKKVESLTVEQLSACVLWCWFGASPDLGEAAPDKDGEDKPADEGETGKSIALGIIREGVAIGLGISLDDARRMTRSAYLAVLERAYAFNGSNVRKEREKTALGDYMAAKAEIIAAHKEAANNV